MPRSVKKGPFVYHHLAQKVREMMGARVKKTIKTWSRRSMIVPDMVDLTMQVHNGRKHMPVFVAEHMVGHKLGELAPTHPFKGHSSDKKTEVPKPAAPKAA